MKKLPSGVFGFLFFFVKKQWVVFTITTLCAIISNLASGTIWPYITGNLVDAFNTLNRELDNPFQKLFYPLISAFGFWIFMQIIQPSKGFLLARSMPIFQGNIRMAAFEQVVNHSYFYFSTKHIGSMAYRIDDLPRSAKLITDDVLTVFIPTILVVIFSSSILFTMHPILSVIFFSWLLLYVFLSILFCVYSTKYASNQSAARALVQGGIVDSLRNYLSIKIFDTANHEINLVKEFQNDEIRKLRFSMYFIESVKIILSLLNTLGIAILFYAAISLWKLGDITIGDLTFIVGSTLSVLNSLAFISDELTYVFNEIGVCKQSLKIIHDDSMLQFNNKNNDLIIEKGEIIFDNIFFRYNSSADYIFKNFSLKIEAGQKIGVIGFSGSGKTTFINLIMRLYDVESGNIMIDGKSIKDVSLSSLRRAISLIQQEPILFHRTVLENIKYGNLEAEDEEVIIAAKKAKCDSFVEKMVDKYGTIVGETGSKLSGGQRQRVAIARAILKDAPILIMDEGTASLDSATENDIQESINNMLKNKTAIIIAHRLSTLKKVDRLLVFHKGMIVEDGTHAELIKKNGYYKKFLQMQEEKLSE